MCQQQFEIARMYVTFACIRLDRHKATTKSYNMQMPLSFGVLDDLYIVAHDGECHCCEMLSRENKGWKES